MNSRELQQEIIDIEEAAGSSIDPTHRLILYRLGLLENGLHEIKKSLLDIDKRVQHLEHDARYTRWAFAGAGGVVFLIIREFGPSLLRLLSNSAAEAFIELVMHGLV